ncbi:MAG: hypothetical protein R3F50_12960 [Gammaproteobacteria bacterium]
MATDLTEKNPRRLSAIARRGVTASPLAPISVSPVRQELATGNRSGHHGLFEEPEPTRTAADFHHKRYPKGP